MSHSLMSMAMSSQQTMVNSNGKDASLERDHNLRTLLLYGFTCGSSVHRLVSNFSSCFDLCHLPNSWDVSLIPNALTRRAPNGVLDCATVSVLLLDGDSCTTERGSNVEDSRPAHFESLLRLARGAREACPHAFILLWHPAATEDPVMRIRAFDAGINMVSCYVAHVEEVLGKLASIGSVGRLPESAPCSCAWCGQSGLTAEELWLHQPLYHIYDANRAGPCCVCGQVADNLAVHLHEEHHPKGPWHETRRGVGAAVVVHRQRDNKFLMVQEFAGQGYWVPGGATDVGESIRTSAVRECLEEAGVKVQLQGLAEVDFVLSPETGKLVWCLWVFYATAVDEAAAPKTVPCFESAGACWVGVEELERVPLRNARVPCLWFPHFAAGKPCKPLEVPQELRRVLKDFEF